jgi:hypothetical protein
MSPRSDELIQAEREQADYDAWFTPPADANRAIELARRFLAAIEELTT